MKRSSRHSIAGLVLMAVLACANLAWASGEQTNSTLTLVFENDLFYHTDRDYTNGVELSWSPGGAGRDSLPDLIGDNIPTFLDQGHLRVSYSLGQMMFTPEQTDRFDPPRNERPYGGFLYGAMALTDEVDAGRDQLRIQLGMTGPASLAADSQNLIHSLRGFALAKGWHAQLKDEPGLIVRYQRTRKVEFLTRDNGIFDVKAHFGGAAGNIFDYLNAGGIARFGFNMPDDDGPPRIEPAAPGAYSYEPQAALGAYLFAGAEGRFMARNIFLDGNSFQQSARVKKNPFVSDFLLGGEILFRDFRLSFVHTFRSREYISQKGSDEFGTLSLTVAL